MAAQVSVGKTAPVPLGQQPAVNSLSVVFAEDQQPLPVEEQNKQQSEVALSLLGIPRSEVALGIFADVNTYDVNPTEWAQAPAENETDSADSEVVLNGVVHVPGEAGAKLIASDGRTTILTSKRFFRYQPGRVSSSTMGVKMNVTRDYADMPDPAKAKGAPSIKKWGIFDKFDGYYFEIVNAGKANDFRCIKRTQAIIPSEPAGYTNELAWFNSCQQVPDGTTLFSPSTNFGIAGTDPVIIRDGLVYTAAAIYDPSMCYAPADVIAIDNPATGVPTTKLKNYTFDSGYGLRLASYNGSTWDEVMTNRQYQFPFDQSTSESTQEGANKFLDYIRMDAHCDFYAALANLNRKGTTAPTAPTSLSALSATGLYGTLSSSPDHNAVLSAHGWDDSPSSANSNSKVWHLLVNTQGSSGAGGKRVTSFAGNHAGIPTRTITNGNITLKEWFNSCVPQPYRMVYEWRPPRAMFSGDKLDGVQGSLVRWSDVNTSAEDVVVSQSSAVNLPGQVIQTTQGELTSNSVYEVDFTKVTMWKTEFSWYGAVGATFLCYVPVGNNEARWVRVHHLRSSNQHSVASLGNAFLPITYLVHGGLESGLDPNNGGIDEGNTLVKYGASYYIDGGDKGTVKLLSKASDFQRTVPKGFYNFAGGSWTRTSSNVLTYAPGTHTSLPLNLAVGLMGAYVEADATTKVEWVEENGGNVNLYFTGALPASNATAVKLIIPRAQKSLLTMRAKDFIPNRDGKNVRNRLQIYPVKYNSGVAGGQSGDLLTTHTYKNPLLIVTNSTGTAGSTIASVGAVTDPNSANDYVDTKRSVLKQKVAFTGGDPSISSGDYRYGYFLGTTDASTAAAAGTTPAPASFFPVLGKLENIGGEFYFSKYSSYPNSVYIAGKFVFERHLTLNDTGAIFSEKSLSASGGLQDSTGSVDQTKWDKMQLDSLATWEDITRLSGVRIAQDLALTPVPETGNEVVAFYMSNGGYQFDLQDYFAYNKEYLSFPLTDEVDIIGVFGHFDINVSGSPSNFKVNSSLSWEEQ